MNREKAERYLKLGVIVLFTALLLGWKKYVGDKEDNIIQK